MPLQMSGELFDILGNGAQYGTSKTASLGTHYPEHILPHQDLGIYIQNAKSVVPQVRRELER